MSESQPLLPGSPHSGYSSQSANTDPSQGALQGRVVFPLNQHAEQIDTLKKVAIIAATITVVAAAIFATSILTAGALPAALALGAIITAATGGTALLGSSVTMFVLHRLGMSLTDPFVSFPKGIEWKHAHNSEESQKIKQWLNHASQNKLFLAVEEPLTHEEVQDFYINAYKDFTRKSIFLGDQLIEVKSPVNDSDFAQKVQDQPDAAFDIKHKRYAEMEEKIVKAFPDFFEKIESPDTKQMILSHCMAFLYQGTLNSIQNHALIKHPEVFCSGPGVAIQPIQDADLEVHFDVIDDQLVVKTKSKSNILFENQDGLPQAIPGCKNDIDLSFEARIDTAGNITYDQRLTFDTED